MIELHRTIYSPDGVFGELLMNGRHLTYTCEDPDNGNKKGESCIPKGTYKVIRHGWGGEPVKFKRVWEITGVSGRSAILIHAGNTKDDTRGCVLCGTAMGTLNGKRAVLGSRGAIDYLRKVLPETFEIVIK